MHWLDGIERVNACRIGWPGLAARNRRIGRSAFAPIAELRVGPGMLRRAVVGVDHVAARAAARAIIAGLIVRARQREHRIHQARLLQAKKNRIGAQLRPEAAAARACRRAGRAPRRAADCRSRAFAPPPRSNTRSTLPGCEISQRSSGVIPGACLCGASLPASAAARCARVCGVPSRA